VREMIVGVLLVRSLRYAGVDVARTLWVKTAVL